MCVQLLSVQQEDIKQARKAKNDQKQGKEHRLATNLRTREQADQTRHIVGHREGPASRIQTDRHSDTSGDRIVIKTDSKRKHEDDPFRFRQLSRFTLKAKKENDRSMIHFDS